MDISSGNMSKTSFVVFYYPNPQHGIHVIVTCCVHLQEQKAEPLVYTFEKSEFYDRNIMKKGGKKYVPLAIWSLMNMAHDMFS